ncbi:MAG: YhbY family RNA-binding protein [Bacilli bacterium]|nr:YhbY family RNA-binding protein [Bacilli bacterium]
MLTSKQKMQLKGLANTLSADYQIGKRVLNSSQIEMLDKALRARELIKVSVLKSICDEKMAIALDLSSDLNCEVVQIIGHVIVLYRANPQKPDRIRLVK